MRDDRGLTHADTVTSTHACWANADTLGGGRVGAGGAGEAGGAGGAGGVGWVGWAGWVEGIGWPVEATT